MDTANQLITYLGEVSISTGILVLFAIIFLKNSTLFYAKRIFYLFTIFFVSVVPLLHFQIGNTNNLGSQVIIMLSSITFKSSHQVSEVKSLSLFYILAYVYYAGVIVFSLKFVFQLVKLWLIFKNSTHFYKTQYTLVHTNKEISPFSFFRYIYYNPSLINSRKDIEVIIAHENIHAQQKHTIDVIIAEIFIIIQWFNPFAWLLKKEIQKNHEYLVDKSVINGNISLSAYTEVLLSQVFKTQFLLGNNFNKSLTLKRLIMMNTRKNLRKSVLQLTAILPIMVLLFFVFACDTNSSDEDEPTPKNVIVKKNGKIMDKQTNVFVVVEEMPEFPQGELALRDFLAKNLNYPQVAKDMNISGKVYVRFVITETGDVENVTVVRGVDKILDNEAVRVVSSMPKWKPGKQRGKAVKVYFTVPINFKLK